jgi:hypothetical protein
LLRRQHSDDVEGKCPQPIVIFTGKVTMVTGGAQLYPEGWYREPYDGELAPYIAGIKRVPPGATAEIACRMIEHYHVGNCRKPQRCRPRQSTVPRGIAISGKAVPDRQLTATRRVGADKFRFRQGGGVEDEAPPFHHPELVSG